MGRLTQTEIQELAKQVEFPCISLYMPTEKAGAETRENSIRFKNLLTEAKTKLSQLEAESELSTSMETAESYLENHDFWQHQETGLAFFINQEGVKYYRLDRDCSELIIVSDRFYLNPLLSVINENHQFYLLALAQNQVQLFLGDRDRLNQVQLPENVPVSLAEALKYDDPEKQTQYHSGEPGNDPIYHGQGVGTTDNKNEIRRFLQQISNGIESAFEVQNVPLILAGVEYLLPIYRETNSYQNLLEAEITGNPEHVAPEALHSQAEEIMATQLDDVKQTAMDDYQRLAATNETSDNLTEIVAAAAKGQVDTLFMVANRQQWGSFDLQNYQVELHDTPSQDSLELYNFAAVKTYLQSGKVYFLESDQMPENASIAAIMRYPIYAEVEKVTA